MKRLFIHLGTGKTGTTAIQEFLLLNREKLIDVGINYCMSGCSGINHHALCFNYNRISDDFSLAVKENLKKLAEEIAASKCTTHVISSEYFPDLTEEEVSYIVDKMSLVCDVNVIIYFRRQDHFLESWFSQIVKAGAVNSDIYNLRKRLIDNRIFDYLYHADKWSKIIGVSNVHVRPYEKERFLGGDIFSDFLRILGVGSKKHFDLLNKRSNPSLSREQICFLKNMLNYLEDDGVEFLRKPIPVSFDKVKYFLSPQERSELLSEFEYINRSVGEKYLNGGCLFENHGVQDDLSWREISEPSPDYIERFVKYIFIEEREGYNCICSGLIKYLTDKVSGYEAIDANKASRYKKVLELLH